MEDVNEKKSQRGIVPTPKSNNSMGTVLRVLWWNGGGAVNKRLNINPGLRSIINSNPDIFTYGEAEMSNTKGLFMSGYRFLFHRSYLRDKTKYRRGLIIFYKEKYHNLISKVYTSKNYDIVWVKLITQKSPLYFCFFYSPGAHCPENDRFDFYKTLSDSYEVGR